MEVKVIFDEWKPLQVWKAASIWHSLQVRVTPLRSDSAVLYVTMRSISGKGHWFMDCLGFPLHTNDPAGLDAEGHWWVASWVGEIRQADPLPRSTVTHCCDSSPSIHPGRLLHLESEFRSSSLRVMWSLAGSEEVITWVINSVGERWIMKQFLFCSTTYDQTSPTTVTVKFSLWLMMSHSGFRNTVHFHITGCGYSSVQHGTIIWWQ